MCQHQAFLLGQRLNVNSKDGEDANMSPAGDGSRNAEEIELKEKEISCRPRTTSRRDASAQLSPFFRLEHLRFEFVTLEELVELGAIALRELRRLGDAAAGNA